MRVLQFTIPVPKDRSIIVQEEVQPFFYIHFHRHLEMQITWILDGEGILIAGNSMQPFKSNDVFVLGANQAHVFKSDPTYFDKRLKKKVHYITIFFDPAKFDGSLFQLPEMQSARQFIESTVHGMQASSSSQKIVADYILKVKRNKGGFRIASFIELIQMMANLKDWKVLSNDVSQYRFTDREGLRMNDVYQYTMKHFSENITIEKIASVAYLTPPAFCRYFKQHTCKTYANFLNEVRINEACKKIIGEKFDSLSSIAYEMGFNNVVTFNRVFRKIRGITPRDYLKEYRMNTESE